MREHFREPVRHIRGEGSHRQGFGLRQRNGVSTLGIIGGLLVLLMVAAVACDDPQSSATSEPTNTFIPTSTPTERPSLTPTGTPMPTSSLTPPPTNTPAVDPTAPPTAERKPTPTVMPTATPTPPQTPSPTPTATPTPTAEEVAAAHLSEVIPWFTNPPDSIHSDAAETLTGIWLQDSELGGAVARLPWVTDGVSDFERSSLDALAAAAGPDPETAKSALSMTLAERDLKLAILVAGSDWFTDGVDYDDPYGSEESAIRSLNYIAERSLELTRVVSGLPWITDDMTVYESGALRYLAWIAKTDLELAINAAGSPWVADGIARLESSALNDLVEMADWNPEFARYVVGFSADAPVRDSDVYLISTLYRLRELRPELFEHLISQPWFTDGLDPEERSFIITLEFAGPEWFYDLVETRFTRSATISLPLAGEVDLWAFQHTAFLPDEDLLVMVEEAVRGAERFMAVPFPTNDVIVLFLEESEYLRGFGAIHADDHIRISRSGDYPVARAIVYHEIAHFYFTDGIGPIWLIEGGAEFIWAYTNDWLGLESLEDQLLTSAEYVRSSCVERGIENIHGLGDLDTHDQLLWQDCSYGLGRHFFISLFETLGEEAMSSALRELYLRSAHDDLSQTEEDIYRAFLKHTPPGLEDEFRDLYRRLHGGPFVGAEN